MHVLLLNAYYAKMRYQLFVLVVLLGIMELTQVSVHLALKAIATDVKLIQTIYVIFVYLVMEEILHQVA